MLASPLEVVVLVIARARGAQKDDRPGPGLGGGVRDSGVERLVVMSPPCSDRLLELRGRFADKVDGEDVPVRHFGVILEWDQWEKLAERLKGKVQFIIEPGIRFRGQVGEQATMFFKDPSGNALEFKSFRDTSNLFRK